MPEYIASGSHTFKNTRYRFLILPRYDFDLHSIINDRLLDKKTVLIIAGQILDVLQHFHDKGYVHSDIKAENLMIGKCTIRKPITENVTSTPIQINKKMPELSETNSIRSIRKCTIRIPVMPEFSGTNPIRSCRKVKNVNSTYQEMLQTHYLRPPKKINYSVEYDSDDDFVSKKKTDKESSDEETSDKEEEEVKEDRIFLIDFGLASKFLDSNGTHRPFCMDQRRAHDGTLEYTSRDAHMGAHSRRSDLECLGYNLIYWLEGFLPWKDENLLNFPEQVHRMKEIFMADITQMLKLLYSNVDLQFIADFMQYVCNLGYDERPDYDFCRKIFSKEFFKLGCSRSEMVLNVNEMKKKSKNVKSEIVNSLNGDKLNFGKINKMGFLLPFKECTKPNKISPKNLRSKSDKIPKKIKSKFAWADILSTDPDQIAKQRADKEFEREEQLQETPTRYKGNPTYAILEIENKLKFKDKNEDTEKQLTYIKGYTKPMMDILRKRQLFIMTKIEKQITSNNLSPRRLRTKEGLRRVIKPTRKIIDNQSNLHQQLKKTKDEKNYDSSIGTDESSCSSTASSSSCNKKSNHFMTNNVVKVKYNRSSSSSGNSSTEVSDEDSRDMSTEYFPIKKYKKKVVLRKKGGKQLGKSLKNSIFKQLIFFFLFLRFPKTQSGGLS